MTVVACCDIMARRTLVTRYGRLKFVEQLVDFCATPRRPFEHPVGATSTLKIDWERRNERGSRSVVVTRVCGINERQYGRPKFVEQRVDFWSPYKIGGNDREMTPYVAVFCKRGRGECDSGGVLAKKTRSSFLSSYGRLNFCLGSVDFWAPCKTPRNGAGTGRTVLRFAGWGGASVFVFVC